LAGWGEGLPNVDPGSSRGLVGTTVAIDLHLLRTVGGWR
jgi:hypothetical protein